MSEEIDRKTEELLLKDDHLSNAQRRLNQLRRERKISSQDFRVAKARLLDLQDRIAVELEMIDDGLPIISAPTEDELSALRQQVAAVEEQIAASDTVEQVISLATSILEEAASAA